ncbi:MULTISPECIES: YdcF family protein [Symbiopectobacterium]|uniref:YdcF family protein n=1 Tax=Symbiopectobacterium TaxID=801 RepID=UPI001A2A0E97|nr:MULTISPECIES: ElyC/SanA/YdcF family protein [Symbiopectobacterium]MBG6248584.1 YdcF family protein [Candidatus Symbiopectobacterium sp. PLON1]MBT9428808.1 YdcF family protein [Candidatus Symbiopectobacterium endolongispinus]
MYLSDEAIRDLNTLAGWLALDDFSIRENLNPDLLILAGHAIMPTIIGALDFAAQTGVPVLLSGGIGHSTMLLQQAVKQDPLTAAIETEGLGEADILAEIAHQVFAIPWEKIEIENRSTNCGQNADFSRDRLLAQSSIPATILLVQDPLMQRRTFESFEYSWRQKMITCRFINWPVFVPHVVKVDDSLVITGGQRAGIWTLERYIAMILGEVKRLRDDATGYGPAGAGFIGHVDIPDAVENAWRWLIENEGVQVSIR